MAPSCATAGAEGDDQKGEESDKDAGPDKWVEGVEEGVRLVLVDGS